MSWMEDDRGPDQWREFCAERRAKLIGSAS